MKSEQRHELKENELAHLLERGIKAAQPYHKVILGGIVLVLVGLGVYVVMNMEQGVPKSPAWNSLYMALDDSFRAGEDDVKRQEAMAKLSDLAEREGNNPAGLWAAQLAGEQQLADASAKAFTDPEANKIEIQRAIDLFQRVEREASHPILQKKALWHLGLAYELRATDDSLQTSRQTYQRIIEEWPDSELAKAAERRLVWLENPEVVGPDGFYAWYRQQDFASLAAASESLMPSGFGPGQPFPGLDDPGAGLFDPTTPPEEDAPLFEPSINIEGLSPADPASESILPGGAEEGVVPPFDPTTPSTEPATPAEVPELPEESPPTEQPEPMTDPAPPAESESTPEEPAPPADEEQPAD